MKLISFLNHDINEGLFRYWKRFLLAVFLGVIICAVHDVNAEHIKTYYGLNPTILEYGLDQFWGKLPFKWTPGSTDLFELPFVWLLQYLLLAYCVGSYIRDDMEGIGMQMMAKSRQRYTWWISKVFWCFFVNLVYFAILIGTNMGYAWVKTGETGLGKDTSGLLLYFGNQVAVTDWADLLLMSCIIPVLVGVAQSVLQMIGTVCFGEIPAMVGVAGILVLSSYYSGKFLPHGYAMVCRYYPEQTSINFEPLDIRFGLVYLSALILVLAIAGYLILRRKDILDNR